MDECRRECQRRPVCATAEGTVVISYYSFLSRSYSPFWILDAEGFLFWNLNFGIPLFFFCTMISQQLFFPFVFCFLLFFLTLPQSVSQSLFLSCPISPSLVLSRLLSPSRPLSSSLALSRLLSPPLAPSVWQSNHRNMYRFVCLFPYLSIYSPISQNQRLFNKGAWLNSWGRDQPGGKSRKSSVAMYECCIYRILCLWKGIIIVIFMREEFLMI